MGQDCWLIGTGVASWGSEPYLITLGDRVLVTAGVRFVTHDGAVWPFRRTHPDIDRFGPITVHSDCFLGLGAILLPGVTVGPESVVAAGAVVHRDVPPRTIVAGVPGRVVSTLDEYWSKHEPSFTHIFRLPVEEKRRILLAKFGLPDANES